MNYGDNKVIVRGIKYKVYHQANKTFAVNEYMESNLLANSIVKQIPILKELIKRAWKLKPYRDSK